MGKIFLINKLERVMTRAKRLKHKYESLQEEFELDTMRLELESVDEELLRRRIKNYQDQIYYYNKKLKNVE